MLTKIAETTALNGLSSAPSRKLLRVKNGQYAGRLLALVHSSANEIVFRYADRPYTSWAPSVTAADDAANVPFDTVMDDDGNVYLVYSEQSTYYLVSKKLTFAGGTWTVGSKVYVFNGAVSMAPSVAIESSGKLWVSWSQLSAGYFDIKVKESDDGGLTWGSGPGDAGTALRTGMTEGHSRVAITPSQIFVIYTGTGTDILVRSQPVGGGGWSDELIIASGSGIDGAFDAAVSGDGILGVVFDCGQLRYREFDGSNWSSVVTLDETEGEYPQLIFSGNVPFVTYLSELDSNRTLIKYTHRRTGAFVNPEVLEKRASEYDNVVLYETGSASYADLTAEASSDSVADVFHPSSGCLVKVAGDAIYIGQDQPFRFVTFLLSTPGVGGTVSYCYHDGSHWKGFTPAGGNYNLDLNQKSVPLWPDFSSVPADWQRTVIDNIDRFWVRIEVVSSFSSGPIGTSITAVSAVKAIACAR